MKRTSAKADMLSDEVSLWSAPFGKLLLDAVPYRGNQRFLDIGCGTGFPLLELAQRLHRSHGTGVDPSRTACRILRRKSGVLGLRNVSVLCSGAESLPFEDASFDLIVSNNGLNNVADLKAVLRECRRVIRPTGTLVATINLPGSMIEFYKIFLHILKRHKVPNGKERVGAHIRQKRMTAAEFVARLHAHGFRVTTRRQEKFSLRFTNGSALFDHPFMRGAFLPAWRSLIPPHLRTAVLRECKVELDAVGPEGVVLTIPMLCVKADPITG